MKYDFDKVIDRRNTDSIKWKVAENELPMWVADMDFATAPEVRDVLVERARHGVFGYTDITDEWKDAYKGWWGRRYGFEIKPDGLIFCTGVVAALSSIVRKLATPNENVLVQTPVYNCFFSSIVNNGCRVAENKLIYNGAEYSIDFEDLEQKLSDPQTSLMILCNPHNPVGKIWDKETLSRIGELCYKHHVTVVSDEIHCDITEPGINYVPYLSASELNRKTGVMLMAPTKTFNLAGIKTSAVYTEDPVLFHKIWRGINTDEVGEPNAFATVGAIAAYSKGGEWADEMRRYVFENRKIVEDYIKSNIPCIKAVHGQATYLMWLDVSMVGKSRDVADFIRKETGLFLTAGSVYGENGDGFLRLNVAAPKKLLYDGLERLKNGIEKYVNR